MGEDNADAHMKRQVMGREVVVAITDSRLDFGTWERIFYGEFDDAACARIEADQKQGLIPTFDARPVTIALNRFYAFTLIEAFRQHPRGKPELVLGALVRGWISTHNGSKWIGKEASNLVRTRVEGGSWSELLRVHRKKVAFQTLFTNVHVFDGTSEKLAMAQDVLLEGNLIEDLLGLMDKDNNPVIKQDGEFYNNMLWEYSNRLNTERENDKIIFTHMYADFVEYPVSWCKRGSFCAKHPRLQYQDPGVHNDPGQGGNEDRQPRVL